MTPHDDTSLEHLGALAVSVAAALAGAVIIAWLLSAPTSSPSLIGTGATAPLGDTAPVPAFSQEMR